MTKTETKKKEVSEPKLDGSKYSCQVILEKCTLEQALDRSLPTDARLIRYTVDGKDFLDVTRSAKASNIFDLYFDTYGMGALQSIDYGRGTVSPGMWGYKSPSATKKKKRREFQNMSKKYSGHFFVRRVFRFLRPKPNI